MAGQFKANKSPDSSQFTRVIYIAQLLVLIMILGIYKCGGSDFAPRDVTAGILVSQLDPAFDGLS